MKIIIVGCGRLGSGLATTLADDGNTITVICDDEKKFKRLPPDFKGTKILGVEFDKGNLEKAGIERADSLISCTESDDINALVARIARNYYRVPRVIARLYDQRKVDLYNALGIQIIATTRWGIARAKELLTFSHLENVMSIGNTPVEIVRITVSGMMAGNSIRDLFPVTDVQPIAISRGNQSFIPTRTTILEAGDILYLSALDDTLQQVKRTLDL